MYRNTPLAHTIARCLLIAALALNTLNAAAAVNCSIAVTNVGPIAYVPSTAATNITQSSFTLTCSATNNPSVGAHTFQVGKSNAGFAGPLIYNVWQNSGCTTTWGTTNATNTIPITLTLVTKNVAVTSPATPFWACVPGSQSVAAGTYSDTNSLTITSGNGTLAPTPTTFTVSILTPATCTTTTPGTVFFAYTSFQAGIQAATGGAFSVTCTNTLPYTFTITQNNLSLLGLNYSLGTSAAGGTGNGAAQSYSVTGSMAASQSGTCASAGGNCNATNATNTLTINY